MRAIEALVINNKANAPAALSHPGASAFCCPLMSPQESPMQSHFLFVRPN
jgi:hypothetical protein